jgi:hypothetical protein
MDRIGTIEGGQEYMEESILKIQNGSREYLKILNGFSDTLKEKSIKARPEWTPLATDATTAEVRARLAQIRREKEEKAKAQKIKEQ